MEEVLGHGGWVFRCSSCRTLQRVKTSVDGVCQKCGKQGTLERCKLAVYDGQIKWYSKSDPIPYFAILDNKQTVESKQP